MILSILDIKRTIIKYIFFTIFILVFGQIYEHFSFGVISNYMIYAFLIPLILGLLINTIIYFTKIVSSKMGSCLYNNGIITLTVGSILRGVLDIYGTTNMYLKIYLYAGVLLIIAGIILYIINIIKNYTFKII